MSRRGTNIRKRTDGRWEGRYYIVDTAGSKKCKSVYGHSYKEVTERLLTAKAASLNQTAAPKQSAITVKAVAEKWLKSIATNRKCSTIQKYSTIYNKYITSFIFSKSLYFHIKKCQPPFTEDWHLIFLII